MKGLLLLDFVKTKLDLYKKLTDPKVNEFFKRIWFDGFQKQYAGLGGGLNYIISDWIYL